MNIKTLYELLAEWAVHPPGMWENKDGPDGWYAVSNDDGIVAYFNNERDAFAFRLNKINQILNG